MVSGISYGAGLKQEGGDGVGSVRGSQEINS